ncbi:MAG: hypothetical protein VYB72_06605 [Planctomycetota bacterium]|nr:hypothetical protein [Planctomycetota bacterium]
MKRICVVALMLLAATTCRGEDLSGFGLSGLENVSDAEAMDVRGRGLDASISSITTSSMAFSIVDSASGSVFNLNSTSQMTGLDSMFSDLESVDSGVQSIGISNTGGVQFGAATFSIGDTFRFNMDGFAAIGQVNQLGGASSGLDFQLLLQ